MVHRHPEVLQTGQQIKKHLARPHRVRFDDPLLVKSLLLALRPCFLLFSSYYYCLFLLLLLLLLFILLLLVIFLTFLLFLMFLFRIVLLRLFVVHILLGLLRFILLLLMFLLFLLLILLLLDRNNMLREQQTFRLEKFSSCSWLSILCSQDVASQPQRTKLSDKSI